MSEKIKLNICKQSLKYVHKEGWTNRILVKAANDLGFPDVTSQILKNGVFDVINYLTIKSHDIAIDKILKNQKKLCPKEILKYGILTKMKVLRPYSHRWQEAMLIGAKLDNLETTKSAIKKFSDDLWHVIGDDSTDLMWYFKRMALSLITSSTVPIDLIKF
ncbi:hypothetical protein MHBO_002170 [Bonamia ostreae]|uniref:Ubiquinone biosynthesis protein n=1 Tax=Bonamia ostreae TaxID=126728 RepID=A0ABV2ALE2_9EUKA